MALARRKPSRVSSEPESDFDRVLVLLATDPTFEERVLANPDAALAGFDLDEDERTVLLQYRRWRIFK